MRRPALLVAATGALVLGTVALLPQPRAAAVVPINVRIQCNGEAVGEVNINPYTATLSKRADDRARFMLLGGSDVDTVTVQPKTNVRWPFLGEPPTFGSGSEATTEAIAPDATPGEYGYDLVVLCGLEPDVIDPKMDIDP